MMRAVVVVPAFNEEATIGACLRSLADQQGVARSDYAVVVVLNACTDGTEAAARAAAAASPGFQMLLRTGPGGGPGPARRIGMDLASRLLPPRGLIASTDADTIAAPDWLLRQLEAIEAGADAVGGWIELDDHGLLPAVVEHRRLRGRERFRRVLEHTPDAEHHHFAGASMSLTAEAYARLGGIEPLPALEDEALERALRRHGFRIVRTRAVEVRTSGRLQGRASAGLACDLAEATRMFAAGEAGAA